MCRELTRNSACEASRKLRSVRASCKTQLYSKASLDARLNCSKPAVQHGSPGPLKRDPARTVTLASVALNLFFFTILAVKLLIRLNTCQIRRDKQRYIQKSFRAEAKPSAVGDPYANEEETRNALLEAFELSRR